MRKLMWFTLGFALACFLCAYFYATWLTWVAVGSAAICFFGLLISRERPVLRMTSIFLLGIALGLGWFALYNTWYLGGARELQGNEVELTITADDYSAESNYGCAVSGSVTLHGKTYRVWTYLNEISEVSPGDVVTGRFRLNFTADLDGDTAPQHRGKGLFLIASQRGEVDIEIDGNSRWYHQPARWRQELIMSIDRAFPEDVAGFAKALLLGDREGIDYEMDTAFRLSGISHIIAVSGLHVSILFGVIYLLTLHKRVLTALIGIPAVLLFAAVAGFSPSVTRASLMHILMMLAMLFDKEYDSPTALSFASLTILTANPLTISSVSFQLSVSCLAGIFLFSPGIRGWLLDEKCLGRWKGKSIKSRMSGWFAASVSITLGASVFTTPLVAYYFGVVSLVSLLTNLLTLWVVTIVFYGMMAVCALSFLTAAGAGILGWLVAWPIRYILSLCKILAAFPLSAVYTTEPYIVAWLVFCYLLLIVFALSKQKKPVPFICGGVVALCVCLAICWTQDLLTPFRVTMLDVGQGQSILLQSDGKTFLVDCGGDYDDGAADTVADTLLSRGILKLDGIILTHYDRDHSGGVKNLFLSRVDTERLLLPFALDEENMADALQIVTSAETHYVKEDLAISYGETKITLFAPESYNSGNESSMCILFQRRDCDILITGDRGAKGEAVLLRRHNLPQVDLLVVGHHGAKDAASEELLMQIRPSCAWISVGENNRYGHPSQTVLDRLETYNCQVYRTDLNGTLVWEGE